MNLKKLTKDFRDNCREFAIYGQVMNTIIRLIPFLISLYILATIRLLIKAEAKKVLYLTLFVIITYICIAIVARFKISKKIGLPFFYGWKLVHPKIGEILNSEFINLMLNNKISCDNDKSEKELDNIVRLLYKRADKNKFNFLKVHLSILGGIIGLTGIKFGLSDPTNLPSIIADLGEYKEVVTIFIFTYAIFFFLSYLYTILIINYEADSYRELADKIDEFRLNKKTN